jgi:NADH:ubiquinone oxidoreductase subunit 6 (subunit J)
MSLPFAIVAVLTIAAAVAAVSQRNLVHCALALVVAFVGLAAAYLQLDAQFVGFAQILVYVGAVAILIVFAILLTRGGDTPQQTVFSTSWLAGAVVAVAVFGLVSWTILKSGAVQRDLPAKPEATVKQIGDALMTKYVLPLEVAGLLLTAALIGAVIIAMRDHVAADVRRRTSNDSGKPKAESPPPHVGGDDT